MKKLLVVAVAVLVSASAFAQKSMVKLDGCLNDGRCDTLDFNRSGDDVENAEAAAQTLVLNYAYLFTDNFGAGLTYGMSSSTQDGDVKDATQADNYTDMVLSAYWNIHGGWANSSWVGLHLGTRTFAESDETDTAGNESVSTTTLEYGHRFALGSLAGVNWLWSPSVSYAMTKTASNTEGADDVAGTELALNVANFAVTF